MTSMPRGCVALMRQQAVTDVAHHGLAHERQKRTPARSGEATEAREQTAVSHHSRTSG